MPDCYVRPKAQTQPARFWEETILGQTPCPGSIEPVISSRKNKTSMKVMEQAPGWIPPDKREDCKEPDQKWCKDHAHGIVGPILEGAFEPLIELGSQSTVV